MLCVVALAIGAALSEVKLLLKHFDTKWTLDYLALVVNATLTTTLMMASRMTIFLVASSSENNVDEGLSSRVSMPRTAIKAARMCAITIISKKTSQALMLLDILCVL